MKEIFLVFRVRNEVGQSHLFSQADAWGKSKLNWGHVIPDLPGFGGALHPKPR